MVPPARAHRYYTGPELYRHKNVMKRLRTGRGRQMARKIKENGNNGQRTAGQTNIFVFLGTIRVAHQASVCYFCPGLTNLSPKFLENFFPRIFRNFLSLFLFWFLSGQSQRLNVYFLLSLNVILDLSPSSCFQK